MTKESGSGGAKKVRLTEGANPKIGKPLKRVTGAAKPEAPPPKNPPKGKDRSRS